MHLTYLYDILLLPLLLPSAHTFITTIDAVAAVVAGAVGKTIDVWMQFLCEGEHSKVLPLFQSLLNTVVTYDPVGRGLPYNYTLFSDADHEAVVEVCVWVDGWMGGDRKDELRGTDCLLRNHLN